MHKKEKIRLIGHIVAGIVILLHSYERYEKDENFWIHLIAGLVFLSVATFHHPLSKKIKWIDGAFYFIEGLTLFYTAYEYFHYGKKALPFAYLAAAIAYVIAAVVIGRKKMRAPAHPLT